jgi:hypothetical protein
MDNLATTMSKSGVVWGKPEQSAAKITKWLILGVLAVTGFWFWGIIVPFVLATLANTLLAGLCAAGIVLLGLVASSKKTHALCSYAGRSLFRAIAGFWVEVDPIGILKNRADDADKSYVELDNNTKALNGEIEALDRLLTSNQLSAKAQLSTYKRAKAGEKNEENQEAAIMSATELGLLKESDVTLQDLRNRMAALYEVLKKIRFNVKIFCRRMRSEINVKERDFKAINKAYNAYSSAMAALNPDSSRREMYEMACAKLEENYSTKLGAIKDFVDSSKGFLAGLNLEQGAWQEEAEQMLAQMEEKSALLLGDGAETVIVGEYEEPGAVPVRRDDVSSLFAAKR